MLNKAMLRFLLSGDSLWESIVSWYENSLLNEIIQYLEGKYFSVDFGAYENFALSSDAGATAQTIIIGIAIGIVIATGVTAFTRNKLGGFVHKLIKQECHSPESAQTLLELGYFRSETIRRELTRGINLRTVVRCKEEEDFLISEYESTKPQSAECAEEQTEDSQDPVAAQDASAVQKGRKSGYKIDFQKDRFYIPQDLKYRAEIRFERKGSGWILFAASFLIAVLFMGIACWALPELLQMADNLISMIAPQ